MTKLSLISHQVSSQAHEGDEMPASHRLAPMHYHRAEVEGISSSSWQDQLLLEGDVLGHLGSGAVEDAKMQFGRSDAAHISVFLLESILKGFPSMPSAGCPMNSHTTCSPPVKRVVLLKFHSSASLTVPTPGSSMLSERQVSHVWTESWTCSSAHVTVSLVVTLKRARSSSPVGSFGSRSRRPAVSSWLCNVSSSLTAYQ